MVSFALPFCGLGFDLQVYGLLLTASSLGSVWLEVESVRGGKFLIVEKRPKGLEVWAGRLHIVADRKPR